MFVVWIIVFEIILYTAILFYGFLVHLFNLYVVL